MIRLCACMGRQYDEPYCPCEMEDRGIAPSQARIDATAEANRRLKELFGPGGTYYQSQPEQPA